MWCWCIVDKTLESNGETAVNHASLSRYPVAQLLDKADEYINSFDYGLARRFCQRAVDAEHENTRALETLGFVELQSGDYEEAKRVFFSCMVICCGMLSHFLLLCAIVFIKPHCCHNLNCSLIGPIPWGHSGPLCHALSLSLSSWTSMRRRRATVLACDSSDT